MALNLGEWFCLKEGRSSLQPVLPYDGHFLFCHEGIVEAGVRLSIEKSFATDQPVKMLILGNWGVGKTHLLHNLQWWLEENRADYPCHPVSIEVGDIEKKSRFDSIVAPLLSQMGIDYLVQLVNDFRSMEPNVNQALIDHGVSHEVAKALTMFQLTVPGQPAAPHVQTAFEFLRGGGTGKNLSDAGLSGPITESATLYKVLLGIGYMHRRVHKHRLLFIADEAARLELVEADPATESHWINANKQIFDAGNGEFGFIYTVSASRRQLPRPLWDPQIQNRLGSNVVELKPLQETDVGAFLKALLDEFVDPVKLEELQ